MCENISALTFLEPLLPRRPLKLKLWKGCEGEGKEGGRENER